MSVPAFARENVNQFLLSMSRCLISREQGCRIWNSTYLIIVINLSFNKMSLTQGN